MMTQDVVSLVLGQQKPANISLYRFFRVIRMPAAMTLQAKTVQPGEGPSNFFEVKLDEWYQSTAEASDLILLAAGASGDVYIQHSADATIKGIKDITVTASGGAFNVTIIGPLPLPVTEWSDTVSNSNSNGTIAAGVGASVSPGAGGKPKRVYVSASPFNAGFFFVGDANAPAGVPLSPGQTEVFYAPDDIGLPFRIVEMWNPNAFAVQYYTRFEYE